MGEKIIPKARWLWEDYPGSNWENVSYANSGEEGLGSYCYLHGTKPKSLFYHYQVGGLDENKHKIDSVEFILIIRKFKSSENTLPTIKVFNGDNNAPYKKSPIKTVNTYKRLKNQFWYDEYTLSFDLTGVSINQLKDLIIEVDFKKSKVNSQSVISINRARLKVNYSNKNPKFSTYDSVDKNWIYNNSDIVYKLTVKNTGYKGSGSTTLTLPKGCSIVKHSGGGSWNNSNKTLSYTLDKNKSITHTFKLKLKNIGNNIIKSKNNGNNFTNANTVKNVSVVKAPSVTPVVPESNHRNDIITFYFHDTFAKESSYFDVNIQGFKENHPYELACYTLYVPDNVIIDEPLRLSTELLDDNFNIDSIIEDETFTKHGVTVQIADNSVCLNLENDDDFVVNLRFPIYCSNDNDATIRIDDSSDLLEIYPVRKSIFDIIPSISKDKKYVQNSINIGSPEMWTIRAKASKHNFFDTKKELFEISIEKLIAYIGCIPLTRGHLVGDEASVKNTLIENRHNNRAYYGKKGDFSEDIGMTLRLPPADVATLEGLCELDKPIPIDTVPHIPDGDPLNHRGWAELHGVNNIKKINSFLYECKPEVTYLTHDLITKFGIDEGAKIASNNIEYFLGLTHNFGDNLLNYFNLNYYDFFTNIEDENGDYIGEYDLEPNSSLIFNSINKLSNRGNYDIKYRNILPALMSEDLDGNWSMAIRILDRVNRTPLFEHLYDNFKHYDFDEPMVLNECDVTTRVLNGDNFDIVNYDRLRLTYDGLASLTELRKTGSYLNKIESNTYNMENNIVETFLYDKDNNPIVNGKVKIIISNNENYYDTFYVLSDIDGKIEFPLNLNNGRYTINMIFEETEEYKGCEYTFSALVEYEVDEYHFDYPSQTMVINSINAIYPVKLLNGNNVPASGMIVYYSFKGLGETNYSYESKLVTDSNGIVNIPINFNNGSKFIKVAFKGFIDNGVIYPSCYFESMININITGKDTVIEADNIELVHGDNNKIYNIILKDAENNTALGNKNVIIGFYNDKENYVFDVTTNDFGVATVPIYLGVGNWFVDVHFKGDDEYKPNIVNRNIIINNFVKHDVNISSENLLLNENRLLSGEDDYYKITLKDENGNLIVNEPITFKVWDIDKVNKYVDTILYSDELGEISFPYVNHNENVIIESYYEGSNLYDSSFNSDIVTFEDVLNKSSTEFNVNGDIINCTQDGYTSDITVGDVKGDFDVIITYPNSNRLSDIGEPFLVSVEPNQTYYVTILHKGDDTHYAKCKTLTFTPTETSKALFTSWLYIQEVYDQPVWDVVSNGSIKKGEVFNFRFNCNFTHGNTPIYLGVGCDLQGNTDLEELKQNSIYVLKSKPIKYENNDDYVEYIEFTGVIPDDNIISSSNANFFLYCPETLNHYGYGKHLYNIDELHIQNSTRNKQSVIEQSGFGDGGETYQDITISSLASDDPTITTNTNDYYIMKVFNNHTYEELFFYSYLNDIVTSTKLNFMLTEDSWDLMLIGSGNDTYKGDWYVLSDVNIDTPSEPVTPTVIDGIHNTVEVDNDLFFNDYNYSNISGVDIDIDVDNKELNLNPYMNVPYTEVEYLQSSGTQYIDTGYILQEDDEVEVEMVMLNNSQQYVAVFGARKSGYTTNCYGLFSKFGRYNRFNYTRTGAETNGITNSIDTKYKIHTKNDTCIVYNEDGTVFDTITTTGTIEDTINNCGLFCLNANSSTGFTPDSTSNLRIYSFKIINGDGEIVRDMVPVRDGTTGYMYDKITKELYGNIGTGSFSYGNDIVTEFIPSISYINPNTLPDYDYVLKHNVTLNDGIEIFDYNTIDVLDFSNDFYNIWNSMSNGVLIRELDTYAVCYIKKDNEELENLELEKASSYNIEYKIHDNLCDITINDVVAYENYKVDYNTLLLGTVYDTVNVKNIHLYQNNEVVDEFTESIDTYEGKTFGSDLYFELKNNILNFIDYGMLPEGGSGSSKIILNDIKLLETDYELEIEIRYDNRTFMRLNDLEGYLRFRAYEDISVENNLKYSNILCSPVPIPDSITRFTRHTDEGTMYYVETPITNNKKANLKYLCNPYIQYKGGTELNSETGISLFNLDNGISPVSVDNGLVKAEFHRRSGYIIIYRYDDKTDMWYKCNIFKLSDNPQLELWKYTDDSCEIHFGKTIWKMWRGRPFIKIQHPDDDFRILNLVDRVYCETVENEITMGFVEEHNTTMSVFDPKTSIQLFKEEWCIGENIKTDNFRLFNVIDTDNVDDLSYNITLSTIKENNEKILSINRNENEKIALNFPASPVYVKKPSSTFSLLINNFKSYDLVNDVIVKCRGFDESGCIHETENIQYGIWEDTKSVSLNGDYDTGETIRVTFDNVPDSVKYIDFLIIIPKADNSVSTANILMNGIMLYEGADIDIEPKKDTSKANAARVEINFNETYYANLYDEDSPVGLCVLRPYKENFTLRNLRKAKETVLIPYMKKSSEWDKPENVVLEYFNSKEQIINIDWEN